MPKYTVELLLWKHDADAHGHYPIYIKITIDRQTRYLSTGHFLHEKYWSEASQRVKEGHSHATVINSDIGDRKNKIMDYIVRRQMDGHILTAAQVKQQFAGGKDLHNIFDFIDDHIKNTKHKRADGTLENYRKFGAKLQLYQGSRNLAFEEMDLNFLQRYEDSLRDEGLDGNYVFANFKMLRTFFNAARRRQLITYYPFADYEMPEYTQKEKDYLSLAELKRWEAYADKPHKPLLAQTAIYFLLGCYTGLRISDWFQFDLKKHIQGNAIRLRATKNGEWVTMPVSEPLRRNLVRMEANPLVVTEPEINRTLKAIAKDSAVKIAKHLTTHSGRHTFAVTLCAEHGIGLEVCAELMGITTAICAKTYYRVTQEKIFSEAKKAWADL